MSDDDEQPNHRQDDEGTTSWEQIRARRPLDQRVVAALERLMVAQTVVYQIWEERGEDMNWLGEALSAPIEPERIGELWIAALGERIAALGGRLQLVAVFPDRLVTLSSEPGPPEALADPE